MIPYATRYVLTGLRTAPLLLEHLTEGLTDDEADRRPDPERFTLREMIAHLADWEPIWLGRIQRIITEDHPSLPDIDEGQVAIEHDYAHSDFREQLRLYREGREALTAYLETVDPNDWDRVGLRVGLGDLKIIELLAMISGHDGYHLRQVLEFRGQA